MYVYISICTYYKGRTGEPPLQGAQGPTNSAHVGEGEAGWQWQAAAQGGKGGKGGEGGEGGAAKLAYMRALSPRALHSACTTPAQVQI